MDLPMSTRKVQMKVLLLKAMKTEQKKGADRNFLANFKRWELRTS
jgi:hypothetical protein